MQHLPHDYLAAPGRGKVNAMASKSSDNVVQMQNYTGLPRKSSAPHLFSLLQDCRDTVLQRTAEALARAMDDVDDTLFALADKANNSTLQTHYFEVMREIRLKRKDIESTFKDHYKEISDEIIENKFSPSVPNKGPTMAEIGNSLIEDDDLEETLAINTLVDKLNTVCHNELYGLDKRVGLLLGRNELQTEGNPIGPKTICVAFNAACGIIDSGVDIKLIVFKLIDRYICETIQHIYRDINNHLAMSGILPKIPTPIDDGRGNLAEDATINGMDVGQGVNSKEGDFLPTFSQLMAVDNVHNSETGYTAHPFKEAPNGSNHFEIALAELESDLEKQQTQIDGNSEEDKKIMLGRENLMVAESLTVDEIEHRFDGKLIPQFIKSFVKDIWKNLLIVTYMKEGQDSEAWRSKLEILDLFIWSTLPKSALKDRKKLVDMLPTLLSGLEDGMRTLSIDSNQQYKFMEKLASYHASLVNSESRVTDVIEDLIPDSIEADAMESHATGCMESQHMNMVKTKTSDVMDKEPTSTMINKVNPILATPKTQATTGPSTKLKSHNSNSIVVEEIRTLGQSDLRDTANDQQDIPKRLDVSLNLFGEAPVNDIDTVAEEHGMVSEQESASIEDECTELVRNMVPGIWFEFHQEDGTKSMERLAWISSVLGSYLFTNHEGLKTRELSTQEVEESLRSGHAMLADDLSFLVDSSFNGLLNDIQKKVAG